MDRQQQIGRQPRAEREPTEQVLAATTTQLAETDALLAEIDVVLERNAAEFVRSFVQQGGQ